MREAQSTLDDGDMMSHEDTASCGLGRQRDYLRVYYSDYLSTGPLLEIDKPKFIDASEAAIEGDDLLSWILSVQPRSRTETYPLYVLTKDMLKRIAQGRLAVISSRQERLEAELRQAQADMAAQQAEAERVRAVLLQEVADLNGALDHARAHAPRDEGEVEKLRRALEMEHEKLEKVEETLQHDHARIHDLEEKKRREHMQLEKEHQQLEEAKRKLCTGEPKLKQESKYSRLFMDFYHKCLATKPDQRQTAQELLAHGFLKSDNCAPRQRLATILNENRKQ